MKTPRNPGNGGGLQGFFLLGDSKSFDPTGGRDVPGPPAMSRRFLLRRAPHPSGDRWVVIATVRSGNGFAYRVQVLDGFNRPTSLPTDYPTPRRAHNAAMRLCRDNTEETS